MWEHFLQTGAHAPYLSHNTECSHLCRIFGNQNVNCCANFSFSATPCQLSTAGPVLLRVCSQTVGTDGALLLWPRGCSASIRGCSLSVSGLPAVKDPRKANSCSMGFCCLPIKLVVVHLGLSPSHEWLASSSPPLRAGSHPYLLGVVVPSLDRVWLWDPMDCSTPGFPVFHYLLKFAKIHVHESVMLPNHLILCRPLLLPSIFPSIRVFSRESTLRIRWPKHWSFSISLYNEYSGLISYTIDWFELLAVQGTLNSLLQHHRCSAFFMVQLSHPYMTTGKTIALTRQTFVSKVMSLLFNMPSKLVISFLPRSKHLLISWL